MAKFDNGDLLLQKYSAEEQNLILEQFFAIKLQRDISYVTLDRPFEFLSV